MNELTVIAGLIAAATTIGNGYLVYKGSGKATEATAATQKEANAMTGFQALTQEQRLELARTYDRANSAELRAEKAEHAAETATQGMERVMLRVEALTQAYRELHAWAQEPCPHDRPPPRPPIRLAIDL